MSKKILKDRLTEMKEIAISRGGVCLATEYGGWDGKHLFECAQGHRWYSTVYGVQESWCRTCWVDKARNGYTIEDARELARSKGGEFLSEEYINTNSKYKWKCNKCNHVWESSFTTVRNNGAWCANCAGNLLKNIGLLIRYAEFRGGKCLSTEYINSKTKYKWECSEGHIWEASSLKVVNSGHWCPYCSKSRKKDLNYLIEYAKAKGGKCLPTEYINNKTYYTWQCDKGHIWEASSIKVTCAGHWCHACFGKHSKTELYLYSLVKAVCPDALNGKKSILKNHNFQLDIYSPSKKKAAEYDGSKFHGVKNIYGQDTTERDARKDQQCIDAGIQLLRIKEEDYLKDKSAVEQQLLKWFTE